MADENNSTVVEHHPLQPFLPEGAWLLMLGSFPPSQQRWSMDFFYPNFINDMWRIFGLLFFNDKDHFVDTENKRFRKEQLVEFLTRKGVALYDTASAVRRTTGTASDKDLEIVTPTDLDTLLHHLPHCTTVVTTGEKATTVFTSHFGCAMPSGRICRNSIRRQKDKALPHAKQLKGIPYETRKKSRTIQKSTYRRTTITYKKNKSTHDNNRNSRWNRLRKNHRSKENSRGTATTLCLRGATRLLL